VNITQQFSLYSTINYTKGEFETDASKKSAVFQQQTNGSYLLLLANVSKKPLDHVPPVFGKTSLQYAGKTWSAEFFALYNGWKKLDKYNADGEDNAQYATADGMPGWATLNIRGSINIKQVAQLQLGVENLLDRNYRYFASGFSAPGRNFIAALRVNF
jgi:hemoglobin/transferrin/lactoferrin receptor protein